MFLFIKFGLINYKTGTLFVMLLFIENGIYPRKTELSKLAPIAAVSRLRSDGIERKGTILKTK